MAGSPRFRRTKAALLAACACGPSLGCQSTFLTSAANAIGTQPGSSEMSDAQEQALGEGMFRELSSHARPTSHSEYQAVVEKVGRRLASVTGRSEVQWEFVTFAGRNRPAVCLPGGKVVVYEWLLPVCENEAGLAAVLSHEMAHMLASHGIERSRQSPLVNVPGAAGNEDTQQIEVLHALVHYGPQAGSVLPFSRSHEAEADSIGLMLMAKAGYNPEEAPRFWRRLQSASTRNGSLVHVIHPADERRVATLVDMVPHAERFYAASDQKHDRGAAIANLLTPASAGTTTVAKTDSSIAPASNALVPVNAFAPSKPAPVVPATVPPVASPVQQAAWIGGEPVEAMPEAKFAAPSTLPSHADAESDPGNPFLTPTPSTAPSTDSGWRPTVH